MLVVMTTAFKAGIALAAVNLTLVAQTVQQNSLNVTVQDKAGARVPNATVQLRADAAKPLIEIRADAEGVALISLVSGTYTVSVFAAGFKGWRTTIELAHNSKLSLTADLSVGDIGSGYPVNDTKVIQTERQVVDASIPFEPLRSLTNLPAHKMRRPKWPHHAQS